MFGNQVADSKIGVPHGANANIGRVDDKKANVGKIDLRLLEIKPRIPQSLRCQQSSFIGRHLQKALGNINQFRIAPQTRQIGFSLL